MWLSEHLAVTPLLAGVMWISGSSGDQIIAASAANILADLDHIPDYFAGYSLKKFSIRHFFEVYYKGALSKFYFFLHSYEIIPFFLLAWYMGYPVIGAIGLGILFHLICDQFYNSAKSGTYFLFYRIKVKFDAKKVFK